MVGVKLTFTQEQAYIYRNTISSPIVDSQAVPLLFSRSTFRVRASPTRATTHGPPIPCRIPPRVALSIPGVFEAEFYPSVSMSSA